MKSVVVSGDALIAYDAVADRGYFGSGAICDTQGNFLATTGDPAKEFFIRSIAKVPRALALLDYAVLTAEDLIAFALACGSHAGTNRHLLELSAMADRMGLTTSQLKCAERRPLGALRFSLGPGLDEIPFSQSRLTNECSGEHLAALALARRVEDSDYLLVGGRVQRIFRRRVSEFFADKVSFVGRDCCGMPAVRSSLHSVATGFARMSEAEGSTGTPLARALSTHPILFSGPGLFPANVIRDSQGTILCKGGLGGAYALWWPGAGIGAAIRVRGGNHMAAAIGLAELAARAKVSYPEPPPTSAGALTSMMPVRQRL